MFLLVFVAWRYPVLCVQWQEFRPAELDFSSSRSIDSNWLPVSHDVVMNLPHLAPSTQQHAFVHLPFRLLAPETASTPLKRMHETTPLLLDMPSSLALKIFVLRIFKGEHACDGGRHSKGTKVCDSRCLLLYYEGSFCTKLSSFSGNAEIGWNTTS